MKPNAKHALHSGLAGSEAPEPIRRAKNGGETVRQQWQFYSSHRVFYISTHISTTIKDDDLVALCRYCCRYVREIYFLI